MSNELTIKQKLLALASGHQLSDGENIFTMDDHGNISVGDEVFDWDILLDVISHDDVKVVIPTL